MIAGIELIKRKPRSVKALGVIPARGGSKGILRKNLRLLAGQPLLTHTVRAALASSMLETVVVSTEDGEIAALARAAGVDVIVRPTALATDAIQNTDVVRHALQSIASNFTHVVLLQPTSPLRGADAIDACMRLLLQPGTRSAMTVTPMEYHPGKAVRLNAKGLADPFTNWKDMEARRQTMEPVYRQNGAVYALAVEDFLRENRFILEPCRTHVMSTEQSVDIDQEFDLFLAEKLLEKRLGQSS